MSDEILKVEGFSFRYSGLDTFALRDISFSVRKGEIALLAGSSGSGKTTLLRSINGIVPHLYPGDYSGKVIVDGLEAQYTPVNELATKVGFLFQNPENQMFKFTVESDIGFGLECFGIERCEILKRVDQIIEVLHIEDIRKRSPNELSDGQKQRVALAGVLAMGPQLLVLDEPTSMLDPKMAKEVVSLLKELNEQLGLTIILVEHRLELVAPIVSQIIVLSDGKVWTQGTPEEVFSSDGITDVGLSLPPVVDVQNQLRLLNRWQGKIELSVDGFCSKVLHPVSN